MTFFFIEMRALFHLTILVELPTKPSHGRPKWVYMKRQMHYLGNVEYGALLYQQ